MKTIVCLSVTLALFVSIYASPPKNFAFNYAANQELLARFGSAQNVKWSPALNNMVRADFSDCNGEASAFFNESGNWVATTKVCTTNELPAKLKADLLKRFPDAEILNLFKLETETESAWYMKVSQNGETKLYRGYEYSRFHPANI